MNAITASPPHRNRRHTQTHTNLIDGLVRDIPGCHKHGFRAAHRALADSLGVEVDLPRALPDAYRFNEEAGEIEWYEVEVTHATPHAKICDLADWWADWDSEGENDWLPILVIVDRFGNRSRLDLAPYAYSFPPPQTEMGYKGSALDWAIPVGAGPSQGQTWSRTAEAIRSGNMAAGGGPASDAARTTWVNRAGGSP